MKTNIAAILVVITLLSAVMVLAPVVVAQDKIVINYIWWGGNPNNFYDIAKARFEALHPNIEVQLISGYKDTMIMHSIAGTVDAFLMDSPFFAEFQQEGLLYSMTSVLDRNPDIKRDLEEDFWPGSYQWTEFGGHLYALPFIWTQSLVLFYNKDMFSRSGLQEPNFLDYTDILEPARKLSAEEGNFGIGWPAWWGGLHHLSLYNGGGFFDDGADPTRATLDSPNTLNAAEFWVSLQTDYLVTGGSWPNGTQGMTISWWGMKGVWGPRDFEFDMVEVPRGPDAGSQVYYPTAAANFSIASSSRHPDETLKWLAFLLSPEIMQLATADGAGVPTRRSVAVDPNWLSAGGHNNQAALTPFESAIPQNPFTTAWDEIGQLLSQPVAAALRGEQSIVMTFRELNSQVDAILQRHAR